MNHCGVLSESISFLGSVFPGCQKRPLESGPYIAIGAAVPAKSFILVARSFCRVGQSPLRRVIFEDTRHTACSLRVVYAENMPLRQLLQPHSNPYGWN